MKSSAIQIPTKFERFHQRIYSIKIKPPPTRRHDRRKFRKNSTMNKIRQSERKNECLCKFLKPVIRLCQIFGVLPVSQNSTSGCKMNHNWTSLPVLSNFVWIVANCLIISAAVISTYMLTDLFNNTGTDMIAFSLVMLLNIISTTFILILGNYTASNFTKAWDLLHHCTNLDKLKHPFYLIPLYVLQDFVLNVAIYSWTSLSGINGYGTGLTIIMSPLMSILSNVIPNLVSVIYVLLIAVIRKSFKTVNQRLEVLLQTQNGMSYDPNSESKNISHELNKLKNLHEELCASVQNVDKTFGLQILAVFVSTCVSFVIGIYGLIVGTLATPLGTTSINQLGIGFGLTSTAAAGRIFIMICSCQLLMDEANGTAHILNGQDMRKYSAGTKVLVDKFLQKIAKFPVQPKCCNIFQLGSSFMAAAATNVATYVLILMQFRLETRSRPTVKQGDTSTIHIDPFSSNFSITNYE